MSSNNINLIDLYQKMNESSIKNRRDSQYWIYDVKSSIKKEDDINKRYLRIALFNREMNENDNLMRAYLNINGEETYADLFRKVPEYDNPNVLYTIIERDLAEETSEVELDSYIKDGQRVTPEGHYASRFNIEDNDLKLEAIKERYFKDNEDNCRVIPYIDDSCWICSCGYYLDNDQDECPHCHMKKDTIKEISQFKVEDLLENVADRIPVSVNESIDDLVIRYSQYLNKKYGIDEEATLESIDKDVLHEKQEQLINEEAQNIVDNISVKYDKKLTAQQNMIEYAKSNAYGVIEPNRILEKMDLNKCKEEYNAYVEKSNNKLNNIKKYGIISGIVVAVAVVSVLAFTFITGSTNNDNEIADTVEESTEFAVNRDIYSVIQYRFDTIEVSTYDNVTFESGDDSIVRVDERGKMYGVSGGSTTVTITDESNSKDYIVNVTVSGTVSSQTDDTEDHDDYILPNSDSEYLTDADVSGLSKSDLRLARNEIYARHGCYFDDEELQSYFESCSWYTNKNYKATEYNGLSDLEKANIDMIKKYE